MGPIAASGVLDAGCHATQLGLGVVFTVASGLKLRNLRAFASTVETYRIVPAWLAPFAALAIAGAELIVAVMLLGGVAVAGAAAAATALLAAFSVAGALVLRRGTQVSCGCFGVPDELVSRATLVRAIVLGILASGLGLSADGSVDALSPGWIADVGARGVDELLSAAALATSVWLVVRWVGSRHQLWALYCDQGIVKKEGA